MRRLLRLAGLNRVRDKMPFYAVAKGRTPGIYSTWDECKSQVNGFPGAKYKKFPSRKEAETFVHSTGASVSANTAKVSDEKQRIPFVDYWPEDVSDGEEDDLWLAIEASKIDPTLETPKLSERPDRKRKMPCSDSLKEVLKKLRKVSEVYPAVGSRNFAGNSFPIDSEGYVLVYTDGSCENNGRYNAIAGLGVYFDDYHPLNVAKPVTGKATNNAGEIQAACEAIRVAKSKGINRLRINTDSQFLINSATTWMRSWKRNQWRLSDGSDVKNRTDFQTLDSLLADNSIKIAWNYVQGHANIKGNEEADRLARMGGLLYKKSRK